MKWLMEQSTATRITIAVAFLFAGIAAVVWLAVTFQTDKEPNPSAPGIVVTTPIGEPSVAPSPEPSTLSPDAPVERKNKLSDKDYERAQTAASKGVTHYYAVSSSESAEARRKRLMKFFPEGSVYLDSSTSEVDNSGVFLDAVGTVQSETPIMAEGDTYSAMMIVRVATQLGYSSTTEKPQVFESTENVIVTAKKIKGSWKVTLIEIQEGK